MTRRWFWFCHVCRFVGWLPADQPHTCKPAFDEDGKP
jgi:hypothetical protein